MAITTYAELQTAIGDWAERTDLSSQHTTFISLAESRIKKTFASAGLRLRESETRSDLTPTSGVCTLPSDYAAMKKVQARTSAPRRLEFKTMDWLDEAYPDGASGDPSFYTILGGSLYILPIPTVSQTVYVEYASKNWATTSGGTGQAKFLADTDLCRFDDDLMIVGLVYLIKRALGQDFVTQAQDFERMMFNLVAQEAGGHQSVNAGGASYVMPGATVPDGSWSVS